LLPSLLLADDDDDILAALSDARRSLTSGKALPRGRGFPVWIDYAPRIKVRTPSSSASSSIGGAACVCISIPDHHGTLRGDHWEAT
jgi:hypothetical protein